MKSFSLKSGGGKANTAAVAGTGTARHLATNPGGTQHALVEPKTEPKAKDAIIGGTANSRHTITVPGVEQNIGGALPLKSNSPSKDDQDQNTNVYAKSLPRRLNSL